MNWSDGGHWIGSGREPNAFDTLSVSSESTLILEWPTNDCVQKYRQQSRQIAERLGYGSAILAAVLTRGRSWGAGLTAGLAASFLLNQAGGLRIHRGWSYRSDSGIEVRLAAHPWGRNEMVFTLEQKMFDENGRVVDQRQSRHPAMDPWGLREDQLFALLESVSRRTGSSITISCPDASVIIPAS